MSQLIYASGYGLDMSEVIPLSKKEFEDSTSFDIIDIVNGEDNYFAYFNGEKDLIYIPYQRPCEKALFDNEEEMNKYIYNSFKEILKEDVSFEQFSKLLDDVFDWEYC